MDGFGFLPDTRLFAKRFRAMKRLLGSVRNAVQVKAGAVAKPSRACGTKVVGAGTHGDGFGFFGGGDMMVTARGKKAGGCGGCGASPGACSGAGGRCSAHKGCDCDGSRVARARSVWNGHNVAVLLPRSRPVQPNAQMHSRLYARRLPSSIRFGPGPLGGSRDCGEQSFVMRMRPRCKFVFRIPPMTFSWDCEKESPDLGACPEVPGCRATQIEYSPLITEPPTVSNVVCLARGLGTIECTGEMTLGVAWQVRCLYEARLQPEPIVGRVPVPVPPADQCDPGTECEYVAIKTLKWTCSQYYGTKDPSGEERALRRGHCNADARSTFEGMCKELEEGGNADDLCPPDIHPGKPECRPRKRVISKMGRMSTLPESSIEWDWERSTSGRPYVIKVDYLSECRVLCCYAKPPGQPRTPR